MKKITLGLKEALRITLEQIRPLPVEELDLVNAIDRIAASSLIALTDSPSTDSSLKDGYAIISQEIARATQERPVRLRQTGCLAAGGKKGIEIKSGTTARILTGASIPPGADAVVAEEFVKVEGNDILVMTFAEPGRNILFCGSDVTRQETIISPGRRISPGMAGMLAAAGHGTVPVYKTPVVGLVATGDEILAPGTPPVEGCLYASNIMTLAGWCMRYGMKARMRIVKDDCDAIRNTLETTAAESDAVITSGGAWTGDRDMVARVLTGMGWHEFFHRIRIGPGKAVGFGILNKKPVFILPGGPSSNLMGFLQIALPGLLSLSGDRDPSLPRINARLGTGIQGREPDWTHFFFGMLEPSDGLPVFRPLKGGSRLRDIAEAEAIASIPEGKEALPEGSIIPVQIVR